MNNHFIFSQGESPFNGECPPCTQACCISTKSARHVESFKSEHEAGLGDLAYPAPRPVLLRRRSCCPASGQSGGGCQPRGGPEQAPFFAAAGAGAPPFAPRASQLRSGRQREPPPLFAGARRALQRRRLRCRRPRRHGQRPRARGVSPGFAARLPAARPGSHSWRLPPRGRRRPCAAAAALRTVGRASSAVSRASAAARRRRRRRLQQPFRRPRGRRRCARRPWERARRA